jgi:hypothetical protein
MANLFSVKEGTPLGQWPTTALERLKEGFGRNGELTEAQRRSQTEVSEILADRKNTGIDYNFDGELSPRV